MSKELVIIVMIFLFGSTAAKAGDYGDAIDAQSGAMGQIMRDIGNIQGDIATYWRNMPERERYLRSTANKAVDYFKQQTGRYPTHRDVDFIRSVLNETGVHNQVEAELMVSQMDSYINSSRRDDALGEEICRSAKATGFKLAGCP
jgi:hypothetical protein